MSKKKARRQEQGREQGSPRQKESREGEAVRFASLAPEDQGEFGRELANWLFPIYLATILAAFLVIKTYGMLTSNGVRALFAAINAATLTGFQQNPGLSSFNLLGQWIILLLVIVGSLFSMIVGGLALTRVARLRFGDRQIIYWALMVEGALLLLGIVLPRNADQTVVSSMLLAVSAFGNCGAHLGSLPSQSSLLTHLVILPLTILGGLGLPVLLECGQGIFWSRPLSMHSRVALSMTAWMYVIGFACLFALGFHHWWTGISFASVAQASSVLAVQSRTGGLPIVPISQISSSAQWVLIVLMAIGASSAGTGGGLKVTTLAELLSGVRNLLAGKPGRRPMGIAVVWLGIYLAMVIGAAILFSYVSPASGNDGLLFNAVSAVSNVGLSISPLAEDQNKMFAYCAVMLLGRMVPLMILWWMADTTADAQWGIG